MDFSRFQQFETLNFHEILIFENLWHLIPATFYFKVAEKISRLSRYFLPGYFFALKNVRYMIKFSRKCGCLCNNEDPTKKFIQLSWRNQMKDIVCKVKWETHYDDAESLEIICD